MAALAQVVPGYLNTAHPHLSDLYESDQDQDDDILGVGTSSGPSFRGLSGQTLSIQSLLEPRINWKKATVKSAPESIPWPAINVPATPPTDSSTPSINGSSTASTSSKSTATSPATSTASPGPSVSSSKRDASLFPAIDTSSSWAKQYKIGPGFNNVGNTCFLNSALQVLVHTAPLVRYLEGQTEHGPRTNCPVRAKKDFCMACAMKELCVKSFGPGREHSYTPQYINNNLKKIASHLRKGRQEDSHEFLRFVVDGMQNNALFGKGPKLDQKIKDSTYIHQIFGGRLRSRVKCMSCDHPSDTFDSILDLSLDVMRVDSITDALRSFVKVDHLRGSNKYKCEKCKKLVEAEKNFTIDEAPLVLTVHLKRFRPDGRKNNDMIKYQERLELGPYMSNKKINPHYRLFGVIHHSGGGPHSGHYYAHVRSPKGDWYEMNDSFVNPKSRAPTNEKTAYVLFYCREQGDRLNAAIHGGTTAAVAASGVNGSGKRPRDSDGSEGGGGVSKKQLIAAQGSGGYPGSSGKFNMANGAGKQPKVIQVPTAVTTHAHAMGVNAGPPSSGVATGGFYGNGGGKNGHGKGKGKTTLVGGMRPRMLSA